MRNERRRAARQRHGHAGLSRRSADARRRRDAGCASGSTLKDAPTLTKIPVLPISYGDAQPLLAALAGPVAPEAWRGALPITYHIGPGPAKVHLKVAFNWDIEAAVRRDRAHSGLDLSRTSGSSAATITTRGSTAPTIRSAAWRAMLEEARALGELLKQGWKPKRTIVYAAWDGEETGLLGSTEWVEAHADELAATRRGLHQHRRQRPRLPRGGRLAFAGDVHQRRREGHRGSGDEHQRVEAAQANAIATGTVEERTEARTRADLRIGALGSGSDYTPFLQHLGTRPSAASRPSRSIHAGACGSSYQSQRARHGSTTRRNSPAVRRSINGAYTSSRCC